MKDFEVTEEQFQEYVRIQYQGTTNMMAVNVFCELSGHRLTKEDCWYIMDHYVELDEAYKPNKDW